jgi:uncharacterized protein
LHKKLLIVAAISSRPYVAAAVEAGFEVVAIDAFADVDTLQMAKKTFQVDVTNGQFEHKQLLNVLGGLDLYECAGFCYGAGFEVDPEVLNEIGKVLPVVGNKAETVRASKDPQLFSVLCETQDMDYPQTVFKKPNVVDGWLMKTAGASGGMHVRPLTSESLETGNVYYQKLQAGVPISCLFLANGKRAKIIGYNEQWCSPAVDFPYRYGGAVSHAEVGESTKAIIEIFVNDITKKLDLRGINSCDFVLEGTQLFALEINPRLSATLDLYPAKKGSLFEAHVKASLEGDLQDVEVDEISKAHHIIYATKKINIANMDWPTWVSDIPQANSKIEIGMPVCTVTAVASSSADAKRMVMERATECLAKLAQKN